MEQRLDVKVRKGCFQGGRKVRAPKVAADLDGDGTDEVLVGNWREGDPELQETVAIYKRMDRQP